MQRGLRSLRVRGLKASLAMISPGLKQPRANEKLYFPNVAELENLRFANFDCEQPQISLIIPIHNKLEITKACLASLLLHRSDIAFELIVVDDASSDASFGFLSRIKGLRVFRMPEQSGYVLASNYGAKQARGEMLVFLNNDTVLQKDWLKYLLETFNQFPDTGICGAKLLYPNGRLQEAGGAIFRDGSAGNIGRFEQADNPRFNYVREVDYVSGAVLAISKHIFNEMHGFDEHFAPGYFEDTDLAMRVRAAGLKIRYQPLSRVVHLEGATSGTRLDLGMKAFQVPHQKKFAARWQQSLANYPDRPNTEEQDKTLAFQSGRKKILIIDEHTPRTDADSGSLRLSQLMKSLQRENCDVHFIPADLSFDFTHTVCLQQQGIACYYRPWTKSLFAWLKENAKQFDSIIVCRVGLMASIYDLLRTSAPTAKLVFDTVDLHHLREAQEAEISKSAIVSKQAQATKEKEYTLIEKCDETWVVSETEYSVLTAEFPGKTIRRVSNVHVLRDETPTFRNRRNLLFVGSFRHPPNADGLRWFLETVWPKVHVERPDIALEIVGNSPPEYLLDISKDMDVVFHGQVADIEKLIDGARINIAPLRFGAGAKGKISQALAYGLPSITTSVAADGMHLVHGESVLIADDAEAFAKAILALYENDTMWNSLSQHGYLVARKYFSEHVLAEEIRAFILRH